MVERLQQHTLAPGASRVIRANIKVSSTETGVIFGNIVYEGGGLAERGVVVLADIHIDIMDYIAPAACADVAFRNMWAEFEWENKARPPGVGGWRVEARGGEGAASCGVLLGWMGCAAPGGGAGGLGAVSCCRASVCAAAPSPALPLTALVHTPPSRSRSTRPSLTLTRFWTTLWRPPT